MEYSIRHVFDADTGEALDATTLFKTIESGQEFRRQFHVSDQNLLCRECHQKATVSSNKYGRVYFKHFPNTSYCILKDDNLTAQEREQVEDFLARKESKRHKVLKQVISSYLSNQVDVNPLSITVDDHYLKDHKEKRRPDISFQFRDMQVVFEIQLSALPAKYILKRHEFYKRNQIYLVWILDDFDVSGQSQTEKDIKYLNQHQNFFYFNDVGRTHSLVVQFKTGHVNIDDKVYTRWEHEHVTLSDLKFDSAEHQVYFKSLRDEMHRVETIKLERSLEPLVNQFREFFISDNEKFIPALERDLDELDYHLFHVFNEKIGGVKSSDLFFKALSGNGKPNFVVFLFKYGRFQNNLNCKNKDGLNLLEYILRANFNFNPRVIHLMFSNGYVISDSDRTYLQQSVRSEETLFVREARILKLYAYNILKDKTLIELYDRIDGTMLTILSAKFRRVIGMGFANFLGMANNAIQNYKTTWPFIEQSFKHFGIWDDILELDKKGTFKKKLSEYYNSDKNDSHLDQSYLVLIRLFPGVFESKLSSFEWLNDPDELTIPSSVIA